MIATVLVPLDGSWMADRALAYASVLARATGAGLVLLWTGRDAPLASPTASRLRARTAELRAEGVTVETCAGSGDPAEIILEAVRSRGPDLVVMPAESWAGPGRSGSTADDVARHAAVPILLVPIREAPWEIGQRVRRILVSLDGSALAEEALSPARTLADALGAELLLLRVVPPRTAVLGGSANGDEPDLATARRYVEELAHGARTGRGPAAAFAVTGDPASMIAAVSRAQGASLIVMTTRGRSGRDRSGLGDIARRSVRSARLPLLLVPPAAAGTSAERSPTVATER